MRNQLIGIPLKFSDAQICYDALMKLISVGSSFFKILGEAPFFCGRSETPNWWLGDIFRIAFYEISLWKTINMNFVNKCNIYKVCSQSFKSDCLLRRDCVPIYFRWGCIRCQLTERLRVSSFRDVAVSRSPVEWVRVINIRLKMVELLARGFHFFGYFFLLLTSTMRSVSAILKRIVKVRSGNPLYIVRNNNASFHLSFATTNVLAKFNIEIMSQIF